MRRTERRTKKRANDEEEEQPSSSSSPSSLPPLATSNTMPELTAKPRKPPREKGCLELCCFALSCLQLWPKVVMRKWFNVSSTHSEFSADDDGDATDSEFESEEMCSWERQLREEERRIGGLGAGAHAHHNEAIKFKLRRRKSETIRAQYINTKELRICVGTWNVGGKLPPDDLDLKDWLHLQEPADIYVLGFQEVVPLNAGNVFGAEDGRPVPRWENLIRETLNKFEPAKPKYKCYSDPPSPSRFKPSDDVLIIEDELLPLSDSDSDDEVQPKSNKSFGYQVGNEGFTRIPDNTNCVVDDGTFKSDPSTEIKLDDQNQSSNKLYARSNHLSLEKRDLRTEASIVQQKKKLVRTLSCSERIELIWPEQSLDILARRSLKSPKAFKLLKSFRTYDSFKSAHEELSDTESESDVTAKLLIGTIKTIKKRSPFIRIISKQMVGVYISIWVRRNLRKHIQNLKVSTVGVGVMGYIGNKGSVSVSMSIYQTLFCFVCCHLTSGEKEGDELRRNTDVHEIHRRTQFSAPPSVLPKTILDHERIIWAGDLNYRIQLPYETVHDLISKKEWSRLLESDQLWRELKKGRAFDGWSEGVIHFPPTYKYMFNSENYIGDEPRAGRRTPAWCDRILSFGPGLILLEYKRTELKLSDHRPVAAIYLAEVEVLCPRKLQRALTLTDAEIENGQLIVEPDIDFDMEYMSFTKESSDPNPFNGQGRSWAR